MNAAHRIALCLVLVAAAACDLDRPLAPSSPEAVVAAPVVTPSVVFVEPAAPHTPATVAIRLAASPRLAAGPAGMEGTLSWDPTLLTFRGQIADSVAVIIAERRRGPRRELRFLAVDPFSLPELAAQFAFEPTVPGGLRSLRLDDLVVAAPDGSELPAAAASVNAIVGERDGLRLAAAGTARRMTLVDWARHLGFDEEEAPGPMRAPGGSGRFGDATQDGTLNVFDVLYTAQASVNQASCIVGTEGGPGVGRDCLAVNVRPANLPGLGELGDDCAPGVDDCPGGVKRTLNVFDVLAISRGNAGLPEDVVGDPIPAVPVAGSAVLSGTILGTRVLSPDTVYSLQGVVQVGLASGSTIGLLQIEPGTRIEATTPTSALVVERTGRIQANGTAYQPVVFTCAGSPSPGCWRGLTLNGNGEINVGTPTSPAIPTRSPAGACLEQVDVLGTYGGCAKGDDSGLLRWVRIEYAGNAAAALALHGVGFGTTFDQVYVLSSASTAIGVRGGTARLRRVRVIAPGQRGFMWTEGWDGAVQYGLVQTGSGIVAFDGSNGPDPLATPISAPRFHNMTVVGPPDPYVSGAGVASVHLHDGSGGRFVNSLFYSRPFIGQYVLDIDGSESWSRFQSGMLALEESLFVGFGLLGDGDDDSVGGVPYVSPGVEDQYLRDTLATGNTVTADFGIAETLLTGPYEVTPDFRPRITSLGLLSACTATPGPDPFLEPAPYCGASLDQPDDIPWFEPAPYRDMSGVAVSPEPAYLTLLVRTAEEGAVLPGVRINGVPSGGTDAGGLYRSYVDPAGIVISYTIADSLRTFYGLCPPSFELLSAGFSARADVTVVTEIPDCPGPSFD